MNHIPTVFVQTVKTLAHGLMAIYAKLVAFHAVTLPRTEDEFDKLITTLQKYHGVPKDDPLVIAAIAGQITSTPPTQMKRSLRDLANVAKRLGVNKIAYDRKLVAYQQNEDSLKEKLKNKLEQVANAIRAEELSGANDSALSKGAPDISRDLQILQSAQGGMVRLPEADGV